jgi:ParB family chromosome partitioning protein
MSTVYTRFETGVPLDKIEIGHLNVRNLKDANKDLDPLKESMRRRGLIHPVVLLPKDDGFEIVVGQRRLLAARELGWKTITALILSPLKPHEGKIISALENLQRRELTFRDKVETAEYLYDHFKGDHKRVAQELGISPSDAAELLLNRIVPPPVLEMVEKGDISKADAMKAVRAAMPNQTKIVELAKQLPKLTTEEKRRIGDIASAKPESLPVEWVEEAKKTPKAFEYTIILMAKYADGLEKAAKDRGEDPEETGKTAIIEWLEAKGFV